ncbi:hypothetical protein GCM10010384_28460 [Streptomyces djakartensis]|uniref:Uncharacterized protein n=1 Tax=Streptomyces djakartensis TaxID=68193 RepID=A0ABQ2ZMP1_9ACTN|nr:hypothetical protein GCM10010384_28460 [Streptomyces djakartensis]
MRVAARRRVRLRKAGLRVGKGPDRRGPGPKGCVRAVGSGPPRREGPDRRGTGPEGTGCGAPTGTGPAGRRGGSLGEIRPRDNSGASAGEVRADGTRRLRQSPKSG